jgi:DNA-binding response OmpR family regulator
VRIDVNSGTVLVDGQPAPELTALEYKLLLLLYGNLNRTCDKYQIVEVVWSEEFLDEVDDARIEKLISRLRQKIEPDPSQPQYLLTVRGRGYKLIDPTG